MGAEVAAGVAVQLKNLGVIINGKEYQSIISARVWFGGGGLHHACRGSKLIMTHAPFYHHMSRLKSARTG